LTVCCSAGIEIVAMVALGVITERGVLGVLVDCLREEVESLGVVEICEPLGVFGPAASFEFATSSVALVTSFGDEGMLRTSFFVGHVGRWYLGVKSIS